MIYNNNNNRGNNIIVDIQGKITTESIITDKDFKLEKNINIYNKKKNNNLRVWIDSDYGKEVLKSDPFNSLYYTYNFNIFEVGYGLDTLKDNNYITSKFNANIPTNASLALQDIDPVFGNVHNSMPLITFGMKTKYNTEFKLRYSEEKDYIILNVIYDKTKWGNNFKFDFETVFNDKIEKSIFSIDSSLNLDIFTYGIQYLNNDIDNHPRYAIYGGIENNILTYAYKKDSSSLQYTGIMLYPNGIIEYSLRDTYNSPTIGTICIQPIKKFSLPFTDLNKYTIIASYDVEKKDSKIEYDTEFYYEAKVEY